MVGRVLCVNKTGGILKKSILDILFASEKRKNVMLLLKDGPQEMNFLLDNLDTSRQALLPQMKILKERDLIFQSDDSYGLTNTGKLIANSMKPFIDTVETLDSSSHYFAQHNVDGIPEHLLKRINEIRGFNLVEPDHVNSIELNTDHLPDCLDSRAVYFVYTFMHPGAKSVLDQLVARGVEVSIIFSKELAQKIIDEMYDACKSAIALENVNIYIYQKEPKISSVTVSDNGFLLRLFLKNNEFSNKQVLCYRPEGRQWAKELYDHYLKDAKLITEI
ncbi:winged helix-turn-helix domain-containing protein [Methanolobus zinderi]|uniref:Winged helix-turn-helix domain-containing protein n=1 Tax=Methanolobus zinderi TaxID=536044 RepID=A0A7D5E5G5_9EURY|nr:winged helix-turn-helix domain-containing protein [Methanolobus zinderi]KXS43826.1 MAG: hypothetical protein AWU59_896 [Methanolobus sp. T82-4]QLC48973.1 winged helix-turn-helix domain-containing protein [Methanolobus zinderi]